MSLFDNAINKRLSDYSYIASIESKKKKVSNKPQKIIKGKLLNKIVESNLNENAITKRLEQISYSNIDGQRQKAINYAPEGVQMLGQLDREKPLTAITKEMIKEFQENEVSPIMVDGEARQYRPADYEPLLQEPVDISDIKDDIRVLYKNKIATANTIKDAEENMKALDEYYKAFIRDINIFGMNIAKKEEKDKLERDKITLKMEYDKLRNDYDTIDYEIKQLMKLGKKINKENALIPAKNREELLKYEQSLMQHNRNRLNLQQQPYESDIDYYKRLREIEQTKYKPELYQKYASNKIITELKPKLKNLFNDDSYIEDILKSLSDNEKYLINKNFDTIETNFISKHGYNPSINVTTAKKEITSLFDDTASKIQALIKRKNTQDLYIPDLKAKQSEDDKAEQDDAALKLQGLFKRKRVQRKFPAVLNKYREIQDKLETERQAAETLQDAVRRTLPRNTRTQNLFNQYLKYIPDIKKQVQEQAATNIQRLFRDKVKRKEVQQAAQQEAARERQQERMNELANERKNTVQDAEERLKSAFIRNKLQPLVKNMIEKEKNKALAKAKIKNLNEINEAYFQDIEARLPAAEQWMNYRQQQLEDNLNQQRELVNREIMQNRLKQAAAALSIQKTVRGYRSRQQTEKERIDKLVQSSIEAQEKGQMQPITPTATELSSAMTVAEQREARLRKTRSDLGSTRAPYMTKKQKEKEEKELMKSLTPEQRRMVQQEQQTKKITRSQALEAVLQRQQPGKMRTLEQIGKQVEDIQGAAGSGFVRRPKKRVVKIPQQDKMKNRLRLVVSQMEAGNTNPRLIKELNDLYKSLYEIDNAYLLIKKK